jgi:hypothetical protein
VQFTLTLKQGWFGRFKGAVTDDGPGGMPETGVIKGRISFPKVAFAKFMPVCYVTNAEGRPITMREYLIELGHTCERDPAHSPIFYTGEFSSPSQAQGRWLIRAGSFFLDDGRFFKMGEARGSWTMEAMPVLG